MTARSHIFNHSPMADSIQDLASSADSLKEPQAQKPGDDGKLNVPESSDSSIKVSESESREEGEDDGMEDKEGWIDVLGSGALRKRVIRAGKGESTRCDRGMKMTVSYMGFLEDGTEVESQERFSFIQGDGEIIQAIDLCVCMMELEEVAEIRANSRFAYAEHGKGPKIPPNTDLVYKVELLEINPPPAPLTMTIEECCQWADKKREYGNEMFSRKDYSGAINSYARAMRLLDEAPSATEDNQKNNLNDLLIKCNNNLAAAQLKIEAYAAALKSCNAALQIDDKNVKALFRKGKVLACQKEFKEAVTVMKKALAVEPSNKMIHQELSKLTSRWREEVNSEKAMYQRMVGDMANVSDVPPSEKKFGAKALLLGLSPIIAAVAVVIAIKLK